MRRCEFLIVFVLLYADGDRDGTLLVISSPDNDDDVLGRVGWEGGVSGSWTVAVAGGDGWLDSSSSLDDFSGRRVNSDVVTAVDVGAVDVGAVVGAAVVDATVVDATVVGATVVGAPVVGAAVVGAAVGTSVGFDVGTFVVGWELGINVGSSVVHVYL